MTLHNTDEDRIEKRIELKAPRARVWRALTDHVEFGQWFRAKLEGPFAPGKVTRGKITIPDYEHLQMEMVVQRMEPEGYFSYTWHPYAIEPEQGLLAGAADAGGVLPGGDGRGDAADGGGKRVLEAAGGAAGGGVPDE